METFDFEKLAKDLILAHLKTSQDAPTVAGEMLRKMAIAAVTSTGSRQQPRVSVRAACKGIMSGMVLLEKDLPAAAVAMLQQMGAVAAETNQDPSECMTWAMEGMAQVCSLATVTVQESVRAAINEKFMGAGEVFESLLRTGGA
ncbi:MAG: hypothetical protein AAB262_13105 [Elusimicrobiota bacterium]